MVSEAQARARSIRFPVKIRLRDLEAVRPGIEAWLRKRVPGDVEVHEVWMPQGNGVANETLMVRASRIAQGERRECGYVIRVGAKEHLLMDMDVHAHYRIYDVLSRKPEIPSPPVIGFEPETSLMGQPFFVMEQVAGKVPPDNHTYTQGWVCDLPRRDQQEIWRGLVEVMAKLNRLDPAEFSFLEQPQYGRSGLEQNLNYWLAYAKWCGGDREPIVRRAAEWLVKYMPRDAPPGFSWGDARIPNIIYDGTRVAAVLDWDMASLAGPECDLCWNAYMDHNMTDAKGVKRPPGFGSRRETLLLWQELLGRPAENLDWHLVLTALRIKLIMLRISAMFLATGQITPENARLMAGDQMEWLGGLLDLPPGGPLETRWPGWDD